MGETGLRNVMIIFSFFLVGFRGGVIACGPPNCGDCCHWDEQQQECVLDEGADCGDCAACSGEYEVCVNCQCKMECRYWVAGYDTSWCDCYIDPNNPSNNHCFGGGKRGNLYICAGECTETCYTCGIDSTSQVLLYFWEETPNPCEDTGWWPMGPQCDESADCEITGWLFDDNWVWVNKCKCVLIPNCI